MRECAVHNTSAKQGHDVFFCYSLYLSHIAHSLLLNARVHTCDMYEWGEQAIADSFALISPRL